MPRNPQNVSRSRDDDEDDFDDDDEEDDDLESDSESDDDEWDDEEEELDEEDENEPEDDEFAEDDEVFEALYSVHPPNVVAISSIHIFPNRPFANDGMPREEFEQLVEDIKQRGLLSPLVVLRQGEAKFILIDGHHRLEAIRKLGWTNVRVSMVGNSDGSPTPEQLQSHLLSNLSRQNLSPVRRVFLANRIFQIRRKKEKLEGKSRDHIAKIARFTAGRSVQPYLPIVQSVNGEDLVGMIDRDLITVDQCRKLIKRGSAAVKKAAAAYRHAKGIGKENYDELKAIVSKLLKTSRRTEVDIATTFDRVVVKGERAVPELDNYFAAFKQCAAEDEDRRAKALQMSGHHQILATKWRGIAGPVETRKAKPKPK